MATAALLVHDVRIFDGRRVIHGSVLVEGPRITAVGPAVDSPPGTEVVDGRGRTLLPGLIDAHTHSFPGTPIQALALGVTTELDMFSSPALAAQLRTRAARWDGMADLRSAGTGATAPGGYPWTLVERGVYPPFSTLERPEQATEFVRDRVIDGSDYLKIFIEDGATYGRPVPQLAPEVIVALTAAAHAVGLLAVAHVSTRAGAELAVRAGIDVLAHPPTDVSPDADLIAAMVWAGVAVTTTLATLEGACGSDGGASLAADPRVRPYVDVFSRYNLAGGAQGDGPRMGSDAARLRRLTRASQWVRALAAAGVPLLAGTDTPNVGTAPGASLHRELELLVAAGLTPVQALAAASAQPAQRFRLDRRGRIAPGYQADLLLIDGDPTTDIVTTRSVVAVWRRGTRFNREAYRRTLALSLDHSCAQQAGGDHVGRLWS